MKSFFKTFFAVLSAILFLNILSLIIAVVVIAGIAASGEEEVEIASHSILKLDLSQSVPEQTQYSKFQFFNSDFSIDEIVGLSDIVVAIQAAKEDERIEGIYMDISSVQMGYAGVETIRDALVDFASTGKFIVAYGEVVSQKAYYLSTAASEIYVNPKGYVDLRGFGAQLAFFKGMLDKIGIEMELFKVGSFKSAAEPFVREDLSDENKEQITAVLEDVYQQFVEEISLSRSVSVSALETIMNTVQLRTTEDAVDAGIIDGALYYDEVLDLLVEKTDYDEYDDLEWIGIRSYYQSMMSEDEDIDTDDDDEEIAILYAEGNIVSEADGNETSISSEQYAEEIRALRLDDDVKAIVFRVNSGGGSALASEVIWRELTLAKEEKPVVVSFGDVAASGGYYISCNADKIFAQEYTITGSIGVFGLVPNMSELFNDKLGITFDEVIVNEHATMSGVTVPLDPFERAIIQEGVNEVYNTFIERVAEGRNKEKEYIESIAQGRIWTGNQALEHGLIDEIGTLQDAVQAAAVLADLTEYKTEHYPEQKNPVEMIFQDFMDEARVGLIKRELGENYTYYEQLKQVQELKSGVYALMPYTLDL